MNLSELLKEQGISLESSLDFLTDGLIIVNSKIEVLFANKASKQIRGVNPEGHYKNWPNYIGIYESCRKKIYDPEKLPLVRAVRGENVVDQRLQIKNDMLPDWRYVSCNASPILSDGKIVGGILTFRDITESLKQVEEVRKEREAFQKILNSLPAYIYTKDLDGNYTFLNARYDSEFEETFGTKPDKDYVKNFAAQTAPRDVAVVLSKKPMEFEEEFSNHQTGKKLYFQTTRIPLLDHDNEVYGICGVSYDVTEEREIRKQVEEERTKIATASKLAALGMLAAELGHEINNPLAIIRTSSWIMRKIISAESFQKDLAVSKLDEIDVTIQRISDIVTSVKNLSRDSSNEKMMDYYLEDIVRDVQSICGPKLQPKGINLRIDLKNPVLDEKIYCYRVQLSEVLINLFVNAIDALENVPKPGIWLEFLKENGNVIIRISDNGPGVAEEIEKKIFSPFFSTKEVGKGTGLGLSISKEIMKRHGGDLVLNRSVSRSCFDAILPMKKTS